MPGCITYYAVAHGKGTISGVKGYKSDMYMYLCFKHVIKVIKLQRDISYNLQGHKMSVDEYVIM